MDSSLSFVAIDVAAPSTYWNLVFFKLGEYNCGGSGIWNIWLSILGLKTELDKEWDPVARRSGADELCRHLKFKKQK